jgi:hypothetical protein
MKILNQLFQQEFSHTKMAVKLKVNINAPVFFNMGNTFQPKNINDTGLCTLI